MRSGSIVVKPEQTTQSNMMNKKQNDEGRTVAKHVEFLVKENPAVVNLQKKSKR